ncbi:hypothetical protein RFI_16671 [Reticulomyxa filosa]|uniref:BEACH domain-containing protein n=1 Tax=Reticulomyxa filosa TaxID=46433 RepID=X6N2Q3_RETFI|nr:hypothetical protein RFI_16671 [Reticulomyxa filosa]|eukprot:ETO20545.1 hypothetical protein RFI_16671 [Reticulomyxa filosa]
MSYPIMRFPFRDILSLQQKSDSKAERLVIVCKQVVELKSHNIIAPYKFKEIEHPERGGVFVFEPSYAKLDDFVGLIHTIYKINQMSSMSEANRKLQQLIDEREKSIPFDSSWFKDIDETKQIQRPLIVSKLTPLVETRGQMQITQKRMYFQPFQSLSSNPMLSFNLHDIQYIHKRRHMMRHIALEFIFKKQMIQSLSLGPYTDNKLFSPTTAKSSDDYYNANPNGASSQGNFKLTSGSAITGSNSNHDIDSNNNTGETLLISFQSQDIRDNMYSNVLMKQTTVTRRDFPSLETVQKKWIDGLIDNYEYLTLLNQSSGRSLNDLTQYPIFPWAITDYESKELDLTDVKIYRDLSKPMGALNPERLKKIKLRYEVGFQMPEGSLGRFMYGSHYSTPGYVMYFLVRQFPEYILRFQNGKFDTPDRLFSSIQRTWNSAYQSLTDVKELIPQFYEGDGLFLKNYRKLHLGMRTDKIEVNDVELPPWANGDEKQFVRIMRDALESDYVSAHLHEWIDLIWGYKQRGEPAAHANNLFHPLTYEGTVDIDSITDETELEAIRMQIHEFGQVRYFCLFVDLFMFDG